MRHSEAVAPAGSATPNPIRSRRRGGALLAAGSLVLGVAATGAAPAGAEPAPEASGLAQYVDAAGPGGREGRGALGNHELLVQPVYWGEAEPAALDIDGIGTQVQSVNTYFRAATESLIRTSLKQVRAWAKITLTEEQATGCDTDAIEAAARAAAPDTPGSRQHLQIVFPATSACKFGTLATRGLTAAGDGLAFYNGPENLQWATMAFGIGSNAGLGLANSVDCWDNSAHDNPVPLSAFCRTFTGGDPWDLMGWRLYGQVGNLSAGNLRRLGVLSAAEFPEIEPGTASFPFLRPLSARSGQRGFGVTLGDTRYTVEYRTATGLDDWIDDETWTSPTGTTHTDPGGGVIVRMQDLSSSAPADTAVLDFHPDGQASGTERHPGLEVGEIWTSPGEMLRLTVVTATASGASVKVEFPAMGKVERWSGGDRYGASATISARTFPTGAPVAYVASGEVFPDALSGAPVAGRDGGPILLTRPDDIPGAIQGELRRLQPGRIIVLGGPSSVSNEVATKLREYTTGEVSRVSGPDRFAVSASISAQSFEPGVATAYIASGRVYTDALSGAPVAGKNGNPVLLVDTDSVPNPIRNELRRLKPRRIVIFGGPSTVSSSVAAQLAAFTTGSVIRWSGADRFATSAVISADNYGPGVRVLYVASGRVFPDALSGAPVAGSTRGPILLVDSTSIPEVVADELDRLQPRRIVVLGGPATVSEGVRALLGSYLP